MQKIKSQKNKVVYVFIDATNIIYGCRNAGWRVDFKKLAKYLKTRYKVSRIFYYAGVDNKNLKQLNFYEKLSEFGYSLRLVPVKTFSDGRKKADVDSRMTYEMMRYLNNYTDMIVFTGDGDYYWVLEYLLQKKNTLKLFGSRGTVAQELKQLLKGNITDLQLLKEVVNLKE